MDQPDLKVPSQLLELMEKGIWPKTIDEANKQHSTTIIPFTKLKEFAPEEDAICFYPFPFTRISNVMIKENDFWKKFGALDQIDPDLALIIADFAIGSDTVLTLDYREDLNTPTLYRLRSCKEKNNHWVKVADNFETFCLMTGLDKVK